GCGGDGITRLDRLAELDRVADGWLGLARGIDEAAGHRAFGAGRELLFLPDKAHDAGLTDNEFHRQAQPGDVLLVVHRGPGLEGSADSGDRKRSVEQRVAVERGGQ